MLKPSGYLSFRSTNFTLFFALVFLIMLSRLTYFDYIELMPRFSCTFPTITWFQHAEYGIPENFKENRNWDVTIVKAPKCPSTVKILRLIKTAPFNFDLRQNMRSHIRNQRGQTEGIFFLIGRSDPKDQRTKILETEIKKFNDFIIGDYID